METQATGRSKRQTSHEFYKKLLKLTGAGGAAFWITDFVISVSPIAAEYRAAFSISSSSIGSCSSFGWRSDDRMLRQLFPAAFL